MLFRSRHHVHIPINVCAFIHTHVCAFIHRHPLECIRVPADEDFFVYTNIHAHYYYYLIRTHTGDEQFSTNTLTHTHTHNTYTRSLSQGSVCIPATHNHQGHSIRECSETLRNLSSVRTQPPLHLQMNIRKISVSVFFNYLFNFINNFFLLCSDHLRIDWEGQSRIIVFIRIFIIKFIFYFRF